MTNSNFAHFMPDENEDESTFFWEYQQLFSTALVISKMYEKLILQRKMYGFVPVFFFFTFLCLLLSETKNIR